MILRTFLKKIKVVIFCLCLFEVEHSKLFCLKWNNSNFIAIRSTVDKVSVCVSVDLNFELGHCLVGLALFCSCRSAPVAMKSPNAEGGRGGEMRGELKQVNALAPHVW